MATKTVIAERIEIKRKQLQAAYDAYTALLEGQVTSYTIGSRNLTRFDLPQLEDSIKKLENEIDKLEEQLRSGAKRKAIGVIPRDF